MGHFFCRHRRALSNPNSWDLFQSGKCNSHIVHTASYATSKDHNELALKIIRVEVGITSTTLVMFRGPSDLLGLLGGRGSFVLLLSFVVGGGEFRGFGCWSLRLEFEGWAWGLVFYNLAHWHRPLRTPKTIKPLNLESPNPEPGKTPERLNPRP